MMNSQNSIYTNQAKQALQKLKKLQHDPNWVKFADSPCRKYKMHIGNRLLSKGQLILNHPLQTLATELSSQQTLKQLNTQLSQAKILQKFPHPDLDIRINYLRFKGIWPVQDRDFINLSVKQHTPTTCHIASMTSKYPHATVNKVVRAVCYIAGYILEKIDEGTTLMVYISDVDVGGSIPQMFKNLLGEREASLPVVMADWMGRKGKGQKEVKEGEVVRQQKEGEVQFGDKIKIAQKV